MRASVQTMGDVRTSMGPAIYVRIYTNNYDQLSWTEVCEALHGIYPDTWAVQFFPPVGEAIDETNIYHLYVLEEDPWGVTIKR